ncbi:uncharacterized protein LOC119085860 isoform X2 [Bradysia coprophila]|uniref:uncharacterized protein LOC119085860 isoform X2 n=1 Tax=Bradysia coprophila TaxID=38358 RepID=UPI00187D7185|nr:uncharacterized protein LOC119085860 isoform X2 [Bradysia coprophila]
MNFFIVIYVIIMFHGNAFADKKNNREKRRLSESEICKLEEEWRVKVKCPEGQLPDQNGKCREIWIFTCKPCKEGLRPGENGKCIEVWSPTPSHIIGAPTYCSEGYRLHNGVCKRVI